MGKPIFAAIVTLSCVFASALSMIDGASTQSSDSPSPPPIPLAADATVFGTIDFSPSVLNTHSAGKYVTVRLTLPDGYSSASVFVPSLRFMGSVYAQTCFSDHETGADKENSPHLVVKFLRADVVTVLSPGADVQVFLTGMLVDGTPLVAHGTLTVTA